MSENGFEVNGFGKELAAQSERNTEKFSKQSAPTHIQPPQKVNTWPFIHKPTQRTGIRCICQQNRWCLFSRWHITTAISLCDGCVLRDSSLSLSISLCLSLTLHGIPDALIFANTPSNRHTNFNPTTTVYQRNRIACSMYMRRYIVSIWLLNVSAQCDGYIESLYAVEWTAYNSKVSLRSPGHSPQSIDAFRWNVKTYKFTWLCRHNSRSTKQASQQKAEIREKTPDRSRHMNRTCVEPHTHIYKSLSACFVCVWKPPQPVLVVRLISCNQLTAASECGLLWSADHSGQSDRKGSARNAYTDKLEMAFCVQKWL